MADIMGVPPGAIAGVMAKENDWYRDQIALQTLVDLYAALNNVLPGSDNDYWAREAFDYGDVIKPSFTQKRQHPVLADCGPANMQIATAIGLLQGYMRGSTPMTR
ncbi:MAG: hypothetical protein V2B18_16940 [Pseudomonadota bacterium]